MAKANRIVKQKSPPPKKTTKSIRPNFKSSAYPQPDKIVDADAGYTLLIDAIIKEDRDKIEVLLEAGASPGKADLDGKSPLHHAARLGQVETVNLLLKYGAHINPRDKTLATPLFEAIHSAKALEIVERLLQAGADADIADSKNLVPLHVAAQHSGKDVVNCLSQATANPNRPDTKGMTALHHACQQKNLAAVRALLQDGVSLMCADDNGDTPLHLVIQGFSQTEKEIIHLLLASGGAPLVNAVNINGKTPLHLAIQGNAFELVQQMLLVGADPNLPDNQGLTPLHLTAMQWNAGEGMMKLLIENGADINKKASSTKGTPLIQALETNNIALVRLLLDCNADPNSADQYGTSPLLLAVLRGTGEAVDLLLQSGAKTNHKNDRGQTALHIACQYGMTREIGLLLAQKADANARDADGRTPLHVAVTLGYANYELSRLLLDGGADPLIKDNNEITPYDLAYERSQQPVLDLFKKKLGEKGLSYTPKNPPPPSWPPNYDRWR